MDISLLAGWAPVRVYWKAGHPQVDWCYMGQERFIEPYFADTIEKRLRQPFNLLFRHQTPMDVLDELQAQTPGIAPTGFIFHMSRCGSTLTAQMLAALPQNVVISEAGPIDSILRAHMQHPQVTDELQVRWFRGLLNTLAQPRCPDEQHFFVKFDSWHTLFLPIIQRAFPHTPWIFLYRDPVEVLVSHVSQRGGQMVPGALPPTLFGLTLTDLPLMSLDEYATVVLAQICLHALQHQGDKGLFVNYDQLPQAVWTVVAQHFEINFSSQEVEILRHTAQFNAKSPSLPFMDDRLAKQRAASQTVRELAQRQLASLYEQLEVAAAGRSQRQVTSSQSLRVRGMSTEKGMVSID